MDLVIALVVWLPLCALVGWLASQKGRSGLGFFFIAFFLTPLIGLLAVIAVPSRVATAGTPSGKDLVLCKKCGRPSIASLATCPYCNTRKYDPMEGLKKCPACAETIKAEAIKCRFCGTDFAAPTPAPAPKLAGGMGHCPGCRKLRHASVMKCVYCGNTDAVQTEGVS